MRTSKASITAATPSTATTSSTTNGHDDRPPRPPVRHLRPRRPRPGRAVRVGRPRHNHPPVRLWLREPGCAAAAPLGVATYVRRRNRVDDAVGRKLELPVPVALLDRARPDPVGPRMDRRPGCRGPPALSPRTRSDARQRREDLVGRADAVAARPRRGATALWRWVALRTSSSHPPPEDTRRSGDDAV